MSDNKPISFMWSEAEQAMKPFGLNMGARAKERYGDGEIVRLVEVEERSRASHAHYFATLNDLFDSLPEKIRGEERWAESVEHLRSYALIKTGHHHLAEFPCGTKVAAERLAASLTVMNEYAIIIIDGSVVKMFTAKSQSYKAMPGKGEFRRSKTDVLGFAADLVGLAKDAPERTAT